MRFGSIQSGGISFDDKRLDFIVDSISYGINEKTGNIYLLASTAYGPAVSRSGLLQQ